MYQYRFFTLIAVISVVLMPVAVEYVRTKRCALVLQYLTVQGDEWMDGNPAICPVLITSNPCLIDAYDIIVQR